MNGVTNNYWGTTSNSYGPRLLSVKDAVNFLLPIWGGVPQIVDPVLFLGVLGLGVGWFEVGQLWAAFVTQESAPPDRVNTGFLGHNWTQICANSKLNAYAAYMSIWVATS